MDLDAPIAAGTPALAALAADRLRDMITRGALRPGERLKEVELANGMQVSRGPIREAISILASEGLLEIRRHRGARVITMTATDIEEVYSLRLAIERLAMQRAATRMTPEILDAMDAVIEQMRTTTGREHFAESVALDLDFHDLVYEAAGHERLIRTWHLVRSQVSVFLHARTDTDYFQGTAADKHAALRDVLASGDADAAVRSIEQHIGWALERLIPSHVSDAATDS